MCWAVTAQLTQFYCLETIIQLGWLHCYPSGSFAPETCKQVYQTQAPFQFDRVNLNCEDWGRRAGVGWQLCQVRGSGVYNNIYLGKLIMSGQMELLKSSSKKTYEFVLTAKEPSEMLFHALQSLLKSCISSPEHFSFLLHRVNWFEQPFVHYQELLLKILRIYKSQSRQAHKVICNLLIEAFFNASSYRRALDVLSEIFDESYDKKSVVAALRSNYPHKLCSLEMHTLYLRNMLELCRRFKPYRTDLLEIVVQNLVHFDTEVVAADQWVHRPFPCDQKLIEFRESGKPEMAMKLDALLFQLLGYLNQLSEDATILNEIFLIFQNKILPIKTTKSIQLIVFFIAEQSKSRSATFISFLLASIFDTKHQENWYRIFTQSNFYLFSYILRSKRVTPNAIAKTLTFLMDSLQSKLKETAELDIDEKLQLLEVLQAKETSLAILQTIIMIKLENEDLNRPDIEEIYQRLLKDSQLKLHYQYFLREEILEKMGLAKNTKNSIRLKYSNKFLPTTLPLTASVIDRLMKMQNQREFVSEGEPALRKMHKGQTPMSFCSETVV